MFTAWNWDLSGNYSGTSFGDFGKKLNLSMLSVSNMQSLPGSLTASTHFWRLKLANTETGVACVNIIPFFLFYLCVIINNGENGTLLSSKFLFLNIKNHAPPHVSTVNCNCVSLELLSPHFLMEHLLCPTVNLISLFFNIKLLFSNRLNRLWLGPSKIKL